MSSEAFRHKVREYLRQAGYQQQDLARSLGFSVGILSRKLNQTDQKFLTDPEIKEIVRTLAGWQAITYRAEAIELLRLAGLENTSIAPDEWGKPPLVNLKAEAALPRPSVVPAATALLKLPTQLTEFVGREVEIGQLSELLARPNVRLLTLTGPGGVGKTRLAVCLAERLSQTFAHGVFLVELDTVSDPRLVSFAIAQAVGVQETGSHPLLTTLKEYLRERQALLVLDNYEHLLPAAGLVNELLMAAPRLKILVTSRAVLHLYGEHEFDVPPLSVPDPQRLPPLNELSQVAAVNLFVQRAVSTRHDFRLSQENGPVVAEICARLDGLPLAIELAAARVKLFTPQIILNRLIATTRLKELTNGARDLPLRQQSLRTAIDWSYNLLADEHKALFRRLAVFVGGCSVEAVERVCGADDGLSDLLVLLDNSLLRQEAGPNGEPNFVMLETIREYALERLRVEDELTDLSGRHAAYYLELAETALPFLQGGPTQLDWLNRLDHEHNNLRAALSFWLGQPNAEAGLTLRLGRALYSFWIKRSYLSEGRQWLEAILAQPDTPAQADPTLLKLRAEVMLGAGTLAYLQGDYTRARTLHEAGLKLRRELGDRRGLLATLNNAAVLENVAGNHERAKVLLQESLEIARELDDKPRLSASLINLGALASGEGDTRRAVAFYEESLLLLKETGDRHYTAIALNNLGEIACQEGDYERAKNLLEERLAIGREMSDKQGIANALYNLGVLAYLQEQWEEARRLHLQSLRLWQEIGAKQGAAIVHNGLGAVSCRQTNYQEAVRWFSLSLALSRELADLSGMAYALVGLANVAARQAQFVEAVQLLASSQQLRPSAGTGRDPIFQRLNEEARDLSQTHLAAETYQKAWQDGLAWSPDQIKRLEKRDVQSVS